MNIKKYDRKFAELADGFACGNIVIDKFLKDGSALDENQGITYVMLSDDEKFIIGYYNIEVGRIDQIQYIGDIATYVPLGGTVNINYLAIHSDFQGTKIGQIDDKNVYLGDYLLRNCEKRILDLRKEVGISFVTVCSTEQGYHLYHDRNSYEVFEDDMSTFVSESEMSCHRLYKCVDDIL